MVIASFFGDPVVDVGVRRMLEDKIGECAERVARMRELLAELTADIGELSGLITALADVPGQEDVQTMLRLHQAEVIRLLAASQETPDKSPKDRARTPHLFPFRLDPIKREVRIGRRQVSLTPKEFLVIELLWEQMPAAVSRDAILERLYGAHRGRSERVIDVHVYNIRQKLRNAGATDAAIRSKTGQGWLLDLQIPDGWEENGAVLGRKVGTA
ncbi:MAG TPA: winged helix-turn-helix domain-containing protein [Sphingomonas sp.]|nr:winged helix-turn-helix domain-containing protein [Sphingomonas sp.]